MYSTHPHLQDRTYDRYTSQGCAHMCSTHLRIQHHIYGRYAGQGRAHTDTHVQYTSPPTTPHIRQVRRSGTCTHRHTCRVHIPAYKTAYMAGTPVKGRAHTDTHVQYTSPPTRPHIWQAHRSGTCTHRQTCYH